MPKREKRQRIDTSAPRTTLGDSPFAALGEKLGHSASTAKAAEPPPGPRPSPTPSQTAVRVGRTRKGGYAIRKEKRAGNSVVTVLERVEGDGDALLRHLKKKLGGGGALRGDEIEIQGDHTDRLPAMLDAFFAP